jgi:serine/threonine-protein kinase
MSDDPTRAAPLPPTPAAAAPQPPAPPPAQPGHVPVGTLINNNYRVEAMISAGGMGEVYRGTNVHMGDPVAIKVVLQALAHDEKYATLIKREAKVLGTLRDDAIVQYYNFVRDPELDRFCLIMEFIEGIPLSRYVREVAPLNEAEARFLMRRLAAALDRAHGIDVIHRDLSPDNVMLRDGKVEKAVLIDFGIAKSTEMTESTLMGQMAFKFKYASPEQLGHFGGDIGPRTDIYALALLIAASLRGKPIEMGSNLAEAVEARRSIPALGGVPIGLQPLLAMMLEPDPGRRPARMSDVIRLLDDPRLIPAQYGGTDEDRTVLGLVRPVAGFQPAGGVPGYTQPTGPGWSAPGAGQTGSYQTGGYPGGGIPGTMHPGMQTGVGGTGIGAAPAQPYRPAFVGGTQAPVTGQPGLSLPPGYSAPPGAAGAASTSGTKAQKQGGGAGKLVLAALVLAAAGAGGFGYQQGWFGTPAAPPPEAPGGTADTTETPPAATETAEAPAAEGRDAWLAAAAADTPCTFAQRVGGGPRSGAIDLFAEVANPLPDLSSGFSDAFGSRPDVTEVRVTRSQCAVLDLARDLQAGAGVAPVMTLDSPTLGPGGSIVGRISERRGRATWLGLVTPEGGVFSLTPNMVDQPDGSATFSFGLSTALPAGSAPQVHLIVALATDDPLLTTASAAPGAQAAALTGLLSAELGRATVPGGMAVQSFLLTP